MNPDGHIRILLVEDNRSQAEYIGTLFLSPKYKLYTLSDGKEAFEYLTNTNILPDIVIIDYKLPGMDGISLLEKLQEHTMELGCIFLTADKSIDTAVRAMKAGALDFLPKDKNLNDNLPGTVEKVYQLHQARLEKTHNSGQIQQNLNRYRLITQNISDVISVMDSKGHIQYISESVSKLLGYRPEEFCKKWQSWDKLPIAREDIPELLGFIKKSQDKDVTSGDIQLRMINANGEQVWTESKISAVRDSKGKIIEFVSITRDINDWKNSQAELKQQSASQAFLNESALELMRIHTPEEIFKYIGDKLGLFLPNTYVAALEIDETIRYAWVKSIGGLDSNRLLRLIKTTLQGLMDRKFEISDGYKEALKRRLFTKIEKGLADYGGKNFSKNILGAVEKQTGIRYIYSLSLIGSGRTMGFINFFTKDRKIEKYARILENFTYQVSLALERSNLLQNIKENEAQYHSLFENAPLGILTFKADGSILDVNQQILELLGSPGKGESMMLNLLEIEALKKSGIIHDIKKCIETGKTQVSSKEYKSHWGKTTYLRYHVSKIPGPDKEGDILQMLIEDFTELEKNRIKVQESEKRFRTLFDNTPIGAVSFTRQGQVLDINQEMADILGSPSIEKTKKINVIKFPLLKKTGFSDEFIRCFETGKRITNIKYYTSAWGKVSYLRYHLSPIFGKDGKVELVQALVEDFSELKRQENELARWKDIFDNASWGIGVSDDKDQRIVLANPALAKLTGYSMEELIGMEILKLYPDELRDKARAQPLDDKKHASFSKEIYYQHKDGHLIPVEVNLSSVYDENGQFLYRIANVQDITERKKAEKELIESRGKLAKAQEIAQLGSFEMLIEEQRTLWSDNFLSLFGIKDSKMDGLPPDKRQNLLFSYIHPEDRLKLISLEKEINQKESKQVFEIRIIRGEKKNHWLRLELDPIVNNGRLERINGVVQDITEQKKFQGKIISTNEMLARAQEMAKLGSWEYLYNSNIYRASPLLSGLHGTSLHKNEDADHIFHLLKKRILEEDWPHYMKAINEAIKNKWPRRIDYRYKWPDSDEIRWARMECRHTEEEDRTYLSGITQDITEEKRNEELKKNIEVAKHSAQLKQQFLANMSHEIRTPLTGIMGMLDFLAETRLGAKQKNYLDTIRDSSQSLINIINDILDISKIEAGKMTIKTEAFDLHATIDKLISLYSANAGQKKLQLIKKIDEDVPRYIRADKNRYSQIVSNLMSNALKFTSKGSITIQVVINEQKGGNIELLTQVKDTGIGISQRDQERIFLAFTQVEGELNRSQEGTGLGLNICRELAKMMGGQLSLESQEGQGSNFMFTIQARKSNAPKRTVKQENKAYKTDLNMHILLVEDKFVNRKVISMMLEKLGCTVDTASNGKEALEKFDNKAHQIVIMDIQMPIMDGIATMKQMRKQYTHLPPIIALSANALDGDAQTYKEKGMDDYLAKPVNINDIYSTLKSWKDKEAEK